MSADEVNRLILLAAEHIKEGSSALPPLLEFLYQPDERLETHLQELRAYAAKRRPSASESAAAGKLMEAIAVLAFQGIKGWSSLHSWRSPAFQIDLYIDGASWDWRVATATVLRLTLPGVVVECKATAGKVDEATFSRLCCILQQNFKNVAGLGVFFTLNGATGFDGRGKLSDARLRQAIHVARTDVPVVVFTLDDILRLDAPGSLLKLLDAKIRDARVHIGPSPAVGDYVEVDLPGHLSHLRPQIPA